MTALEHAPGVESWVARAVAERVDSHLGDEVSIADVDVLWLERSLAIRGLTMGPTIDPGSKRTGDPDAPKEGLRVDEVRIRLGWSLRRGPTAHRIEVTGGSAVLNESISRTLDGPDAAAGSEFDATAIDLLAQAPDVVLRSIDLGLAMEDGSLFQLGTVSASLTKSAEAAEGPEGLRIAGRWSPRLTDGERPAGTVWLTGTVDEDRVAHIRGIANRLSLSPAMLRGVKPAAPLVPFRPEAHLDLVGHATYAIGRSALPSLEATVRVSEGSLVLPWLKSAQSRPFEGIDLLAEVAFDADSAVGVLDPKAWSVLGTLQLAWEELEGQVAFRSGQAAPESVALEVWADLPGAPLGERLSELGGGQEGIVELDKMLAPEGSADVAIGVRIPEERPADQPIGRSLERLLLIRARGEASLAYHGGIDRRTGRRDVGFPLPVGRVVGDVTWSIRPEGRFPGQLAFYDMTGTHSGGPIAVQGSLHFTPIWRFADKSLVELVPTPFHLRVTSQDIPLDRDFEAALKGLYGVPEVAEVLPTWNPADGSIDLDLELWRKIDQRDLSVDLSATLDGVSFRWRNLPIPIDGAGGSLRIRTDGGGPERGRSLVQLDLAAESPIARAPIQVRGRVVGEGAPKGIPRQMSWFEVQAERINSKAPELLDEIARQNPDAGSSLAATGVSGFLDLSLSAVTELPAVEAAALRGVDAPPQTAYLGGLKVCAEVRPSATRDGVTVQPKQFPIITKNVSGRLLATALVAPEFLADDATPEEPYVSLSAGVQGTWQQTGPSVPIAIRLESEGEGPGQLSAIGAGLNIANRSLVGSLTNAAREASASRGGMDPIDTDGVAVAGRVDFAAAFTLPEAPGLPTTDSMVSVEARLDKLGVGGSQILRDVSAHFRLDGETEQWIGEAINARLGGTAIELFDVVFQSEADGSTLRARLRAKGLPIDEEHLSFFLDQETLRTVLDDLSARGTFDLEDAALELHSRRDGSRYVELDGQVRVEDAFVDLGVPIEIGLVESMGLHLHHEGRELRSRATIEGLFGKIAGRRLENARMQMTYVGKRLVIEAFDGGFEGGRLRALGSDVARGADLFSIDLAAPFPFSLAAQMEGVDIGEFLRGVFDSNFANRGIMDLSMRLSGSFERLTGMEGRGKIIVQDSALWAIPVFQALSQSLGIDTTVLFREMLCEYSIRDGALFIDGMRVDSDLLSLVGRGSLTFEGDVTSDLEVRYRLVDGLGPITRLLYYVQNSLLRVSIRGTMDRPTVVLRGLISRLFAPSEERDRLPLPGFSDRPARF